MLTDPEKGGAFESLLRDASPLVFLRHRRERERELRSRLDSTMPNRYHANLFLLVTIGLALATALVCANDLDTATFNLKAKVASWKSESSLALTPTMRQPAEFVEVTQLEERSGDQKPEQKNP